MIASTQGVRVALHDLGGPADPAAPVLLFAHATGFCGQVWEPTAAPLTDRYRCFALDLRGHGVSETPGLWEELLNTARPGPWSRQVRNDAVNLTAHSSLLLRHSERIGG